MEEAMKVAVSVRAFSDDEFRKAALELENPDLEGYEFFLESMNIKFYRRYREESQLYEYKVIGIQEDLDAEISAQVYMDWDYRKKWDSYVLDLHPIKDGNSGLEGLYWLVDYPWPLWDRDYTFIRDARVVDVGGEKTWIVMAKSEKFESTPENSGKVRVKDYVQTCCMQSDGKKGSKAYMHYYDNPEGNIPSWLVNWACKTGVPQFLKLMHKAVLDYPEYLEKNGRSMIKFETIEKC
jgi:hypothetical protein